MLLVINYLRGVRPLLEEEGGRPTEGGRKGARNRRRKGRRPSGRRERSIDRTGHQSHQPINQSINQSIQGRCQWRGLRPLPSVLPLATLSAPNASSTWKIRTKCVFRSRIQTRSKEGTNEAVDLLLSLSLLSLVLSFLLSLSPCFSSVSLSLVHSVGRSVVWPKSQRGERGGTGEGWSGGAGLGEWD